MSHVPHDARAGELQVGDHPLDRRHARPRARTMSVAALSLTVIIDSARSRRLTSGGSAKPAVPLPPIRKRVGDLDALRRVQRPRNDRPGEGNGEQDLDHRRGRHRGVGVERDLGDFAARSVADARGERARIPARRRAANVCAICSAARL